MTSSSTFYQYRQLLIFKTLCFGQFSAVSKTQVQNPYLGPEVTIFLFSG